MLRCQIAAYPWDLLFSGVDTALDSLKRECGATGLTAWMSVPSTVMLRELDLKAGVFETSGGALYSFDESFYKATRLKPLAADIGSTDGLADQLVDACVSHGLDLRFAVSASESGRLAAEYPQMACSSFFGGKSRRSVCLSNPDVQVFLMAMIKELSAKRGGNGIVLTDFAIRWAEAWADKIDGLFLWDEESRRLCETCFCESCLQLGQESGIDTDLACQTVGSILRQEPEMSEADKRAGLAELSKYRSVRAATLADLMSRVTDAADCDVVLAVDPAKSDHAQHHKVDLSGVAAMRTTLSGLSDVEGAWCDSASANELYIPSSVIDRLEQEAVVSAVSAAAERGYVGVEAGNYGLLSPASIETIRRAFRFVKRTSR